MWAEILCPSFFGEPKRTKKKQKTDMQYLKLRFFVKQKFRIDNLS